jgi:hypothetical protein
MTIAQKVYDDMCASELDIETNAPRAAKALLAIWPAYDNFDLETAIVDTLSDLAHLAELADIDLADCQRRAKSHFYSERRQCGPVDHPELAAAIKEHLS